MLVSKPPGNKVRYREEDNM